jgi:hypothetical protein
VPGRRARIPWRASACATHIPSSLSRRTSSPGPSPWRICFVVGAGQDVQRFAASHRRIIDCTSARRRRGSCACRMTCYIAPAFAVIANACSDDLSAPRLKRRFLAAHPGDVDSPGHWRGEIFPTYPCDDEQPHDPPHCTPAPLFRQFSANRSSRLARWNSPKFKWWEPALAFVSARHRGV